MGSSKKRLMKAINFKIKKKIPNFLGRAGVLTTPHGEILTPSFVIVGTKATIKSVAPEQLINDNVQVVLANTYHLYLQPGDELIKEAGGIHKFMNWEGPIMTDSGGFQVFSLGVAYGKEISKVVSITDPSLLITERSSLDDGLPRLATIGNDGVSFRSHIDGSLHYITPEKSIEIQHNLGADIIFAFDECTSPTENDRYQEEALSRTHAWAKRSLEEHKKREQAKQEYSNSSRFTLKGSDAIQNLNNLASYKLKGSDTDKNLEDSISLASFQIFLDGGLHAPAEYINQETIIRGDELHPIISLASIIAKVSRDRVMNNYSKKYPEYGFDHHAGYGTKAHYEAIKKHGQTPIHRKTFIH